MIPLPPAPASPTFTLHGVFFDNKRGGHWRAILSQGSHIRHIKIPNSDQYMSRERAEELAKSVKWEDG